MTWIGIGLFVAAILVGTLAFATTAVCTTGYPDAIGNFVSTVYEGFTYGGLCGATLIIGSVLFLGGIVALGVSRSQRIM